tara:strand:+ start:2454 stop:2660 length:207 start_codon:yes stop_codon:yes gene_type:complete
MKFLKLLTTLNEVINSYKNYFKELKNFSNDNSSPSKLMKKFNDIAKNTFVLVFKIILIILPFLIIYFL